MADTNPYPPAFESEAVRLVQSGDKSIAAIAHGCPLGGIGVSDPTLRGRARQAEIDGGTRDGLTTGKRVELAQLRREVRILKQERDILKKAAWRRHPAGVIHHSDQGGQYTSLAFGRQLREAGMRPSMGSRGDCFDNAAAESLFATLECELLARRRFPTRTTARLALFDYIEGCYNTHHRHSALDHPSLAACKRRWTAAARVA